MDNDLISKSVLMEDFRNTITEKSDTFDWLNMISRQPVAYDKKKVINKIDETVPGITNIHLYRENFRGYISKMLKLIYPGF